MIDLCALHLRTVAELIFAEPLLLDELRKLNADTSMFLQVFHSFHKRLNKNSLHLLQ